MWPLKYRDIYKAPSCFSKQQELIETYIGCRYENRKIYWNPNYITGIVEVNLAGGSFELDAPVDVIELLLKFDAKEAIASADADAKEAIAFADAKAAIASLIAIGLIEQKGDMLYLNLHFNPDGKKRIICRPRAAKAAKAAKAVKAAADIQREPFIQAYIVRYMKHSKSITIHSDDLYEKCKTHAKSRFSLERDMFDINLKKMEDMDLISIADGQMVEYNI